MKYKVIDNHNLPSGTRLDYLYDNFCLDKDLTLTSFIDTVKTAYFKYDAELYHPGYLETLKKPFRKLFHNLDSK